MAETKKGEGLVYKNHPLRRVDNLIYYGSMADKYIVLLQILDTKKEKDMDVATRVSVQLQLTDPDLKSRDRVVKRSEKDNLYAAMDVGCIWLEPPHERERKHHMKTPSRKILSVVLAVAVLASLLATSVFAGQRAVGVGAVTAAQSTMRTGPESDAAELAQLTAGTDVAVLGQSGDWYHINYNDQYGYLPVSELEVSPTADDLETTGTVTAGTAVVRSAPELTAAGIGSADRYVSLEVTGFESGWFRVIFGEKEGYVRSDELTLNGAPIRVDDPMTEEQIAAETSLEDDPVEQDSQLAIINGSGVNLRAEMSTDSEVLAELSRGTVLTVLDVFDGWYQVQTGDLTGYVASAFVTLAEGHDPSQLLAETLPESSTSVLAVGLVVGSGVRMRSEPNTDCSIVSTLDRGAAVCVMGAADGWYRIDYGGKGGYIAADYLTVSEATEGFSCYALVLADSLNMRSAPDAGAGRVTSVSSGSYVDVSGFENGWFHVSYNGSTGFMSGDYLTLTDSKPTPVTTTTSASSSSSSNSKGSTSLPSGGSAGRGSGTGADLVAEGERYLGVRYVYGGASPSGFDCSGFTMYVYAQFGYSLPHGANRQLSYGTPISKGDLQPGDLVFFYGTDGGDSSSASHVGLYVGDGTFIHASSGSSRCVKYSSLYESYYTNHYLTARRIVG